MLDIEKIKEIEKENKNKKKLLDIKYESLPFTDFLNPRYTATVKVKAQKLYDFSKKNSIPFFNLTSACFLKAVNEVPELKRCIINKQVYEYENINAITPIFMPDKTVKYIEIPPSHYFKSFKEWNEYLQYKKKNIEKESCTIDAYKKDEEPIIYFSCIPWIHFESMTNVVSTSQQINPAIVWGKLEENKIPISLTVSHIFFFGYHFKLFFEGVEKYFDNPELITNN